MGNSSSQTQIQMEKQADEQLQIYYVFKDLENVSNIFYETSAVLDYFNNDKNHPMVQLNMNRLITQLNLSNGIHYDTQENAKLSSLLGELKKNKEQAKEMAKSVLTNEIHKDLQIYLKHYLEINLAANTQINQKPSVSCKLESKFNEQTLSRVIGSMQQVDSVTNEITNGNQYNKFTEKQLKQCSMKRKQLAIQKLKYNFPSQQQNINNNQLPQSSKSQLEECNNRKEFVHIQNLLASIYIYIISDCIYDTIQYELQQLIQTNKNNTKFFNNELDELLNRIEHNMLIQQIQEYKQYLQNRNYKVVQYNIVEVLTDQLFLEDVKVLKSLISNDSKVQEQMKIYTSFILELNKSIEKYVKFLKLQPIVNVSKQLQQTNRVLQDQPSNTNALQFINKGQLFTQIYQVLEQIGQYLWRSFCIQIHEELLLNYKQFNYNHKQVRLTNQFQELVKSITENNQRLESEILSGNTKVQNQSISKLLIAIYTFMETRGCINNMKQAKENMITQFSGQYITNSSNKLMSICKTNQLQNYFKHLHTKDDNLYEQDLLNLPVTKWIAEKQWILQQGSNEEWTTALNIIDKLAKQCQTKALSDLLSIMFNWSNDVYYQVQRYLAIVNTTNRQQMQIELNYLFKNLIDSYIIQQIGNLIDQLNGKAVYLNGLQHQIETYDYKWICKQVIERNQ